MKYPISPYFFYEIAYFRMNPVVKNESGDNISLQELGTEGQGSSQNPNKQYKSQQISLPIGIGLKINLSKRFALNFEYGIRKTFTDYLDDVSGTYVNLDLLESENGQLSSELSKSYGVNGLQRGNAQNKDWYAIYGAMLSYRITTNKECKRKVVLQLDKQSIIDIWDDVISSLKESIDYFRSVYRIPVSTLLPYDALLVPFSYFFYYQKEKPKGEQIKYLEEFFWRISLSYRYSSSTESKLAQDIKRINQILNGERPNYDEVKVFLSSPRDLIDTNFSAGNSYCKAVLCLLAYSEPKDFQDNGKVILDNSWLKMANSKNYHHFFPKSYLRKQGIGNENSIVNITLVGADLNKRKIRAKAPSIYIQDFLDENAELHKSIKSHLIYNIDDFGIHSDDYSVFLEKRATSIYNALKNRIEFTNTEKIEDTELKELILIGENEKLEMKSTLRYDLRQNIVNKNLEYVIAKTVSAFLNSEGGILIIGLIALGVYAIFNSKGTTIESNHPIKTYISGLKSKTNTEGLFVLGNGSIRGVDYFYIMTLDSAFDGYVKHKINARSTLIKELKDSTIEPYIIKNVLKKVVYFDTWLKDKDTVTSYEEYGRLFGASIPDSVRYENIIYVPKGTVTENISWEEL